jgi:hypothetical protein
MNRANELPKLVESSDNSEAMRTYRNKKLGLAMNDLLNSSELNQDELDLTSVEAVTFAVKLNYMQNASDSLYIEAIERLLACTDLNLQDMENETEYTIRKTRNLLKKLGRI